ncbi:MAG TPA: hypothetical protein VFR51_00380, partial [Pyrinomonadaceae bacterium]|nr:hypothetical protein [Pyrinomonadaceae bacterium]
KQEPAKPSGPERKTDTGRAVYGGGGITPDENVNPRTVNIAQRRMLSPIFSFVRELVNGRVRGLESSRIPRSIYDHELTNEEYRVTDTMYRAFRDFVANDPAYNITPAMVDRYRPFVELELRFNIVTAAYGRVIGDRVFITTDDPQVSKAVDVLPKARNLARGTADASIRQ